MKSGFTLTHRVPVCAQYLTFVFEQASSLYSHACPQDEVLVGTLSVRETLLYAALLRLPSSMAYADKVCAYELCVVKCVRLDAVGMESRDHSNLVPLSWSLMCVPLSVQAARGVW